ncbi:MAG TPA: hypothetical protein VGB89_05555 [Bacteroidota bacterium]|jgi:hypothetical protein
MEKRKLILLGLTLICLATFNQSGIGQQGRNRFVVNVGWETNRHTIVGVLGYDFLFSEPKTVSFTPELNVYGGILTLSGSFKYYSPIEQQFILFVQGGGGITFQVLGLIPTAVLAAGSGFTLSKNVTLHLEVRILLLGDLDANLSTGGAFSSSKTLNVQKYPPLGVSLGVAF